MQAIEVVALVQRKTPPSFAAVVPFIHATRTVGSAGSGNTMSSTFRLPVFGVSKPAPPSVTASFVNVTAAGAAVAFVER